VGQDLSCGGLLVRQQTIGTHAKPPHYGGFVSSYVDPKRFTESASRHIVAVGLVAAAVYAAGEHSHPATAA
jgi:hypothetical protein